ncbi:DNA topoisomerase I [Theileria orientalis]|uniref:DNA topoisomerase 1 n=1 Tax=Theileria orientalis TaxID=68886 RepID=A0A976MCS9_THEOR|nr:DNA topoisomerase I [Theileria orientalis]
MDSQLWVPVPKLQNPKSEDKKDKHDPKPSITKPTHTDPKKVSNSDKMEPKNKSSVPKPTINISKVLDNQEKFSLDIKINKKRTLDDMFDDDFDQISSCSNSSSSSASVRLDTHEDGQNLPTTSSFQNDKSTDDIKHDTSESKSLDGSPSSDSLNSVASKSEESSSLATPDTQKRERSNEITVDVSKRKKTDSSSSASEGNRSATESSADELDKSSSEEPLSERLKSLTQESNKESPIMDEPLKQLEEHVVKKEQEETKKEIKPRKKEEKVKTEGGVKKETTGRKEKTVDPILIEDTMEPINRWWEEIDDDMDYNKGLEYESKSSHWKYLEHNGMIFTPEYVPHNVPIKVKGETIYLPPHIEEIATMWAQSIGTNYETSEIYCKNFWGVFAGKFDKEHAIRKCKLSDVDFSLIKNHLEEEKQKKKDNKEFYKAKQQEDAKREYRFNYALVDWIREKVSSNKLEPPGLFKGRGLHPKQGLLKLRMFPKDVILNMSKDAPVPKVSNFMREGHCWKDIYHDNTVTWLSYYKDSINDQYKYMYLSAQSKFKGFHDFLKYNKARELKSYISKIREDYNAKMLSLDMYEKQLGTAVYLIDFLALRVGGEKDADEADTVGCCSLRVEHIKFSEKKKNTITLDFLGKDSIRYYNTVTLHDVAYDNLAKFCNRKKPSAEIFNLINTTKLNDYLKELMDGLSAKVFRTYNASITLQNQFKRLRSKRKNFSNIGLVGELKDETQDGVVGDGVDEKNEMDTVRTSSSHSSANTDNTNYTTNSIDINNIEEMDEMGSDNEDNSSNNEVNEGVKAEDGVKKEGEKEEEGKKKRKAKDRITKDVTVDLTNVSELLQFYNYANREVAILCNHQRSIPKQHETSMSKLKVQADMLKEDIQELTEYLKYLESNSREEFTFTSKVNDVNGNPRKLLTRQGMKMDVAKNKLAALKKKQKDHTIKMRIKDSNKTVALGTSKINYMDPRITVAFCKKYEIPIEKIFNKSLRMKFPWAMYVRSDFKF